eukprot:18233-Chlamydomonas_euryale.AAC.4
MMRSRRLSGCGGARGSANAAQRPHRVTVLAVKGGVVSGAPRASPNRIALQPASAAPGRARLRASAQRWCGARIDASIVEDTFDADGGGGCGGRGRRPRHGTGGDSGEGGDGFSDGHSAHGNSSGSVSASIAAAAALLVAAGIGASAALPSAARAAPAVAAEAPITGRYGVPTAGVQDRDRGRALREAVRIPTSVAHHSKGQTGAGQVGAPARASGRVV